MRFLTLTAALMAPSFAPAADPTPPVYEMRTYTAAAGKLDALHSRFKDHTLKLFAKHNITSVGYFTPADNKDNKLVFVLSYPSQEAREASWKAFQADPDWQAALKASEAGGKLVEKVDQRFMSPTDYSPALKVEATGGRVFELRTYTATKGHLPDLNARFRDHTVKLFEKYGMTNVVYWNLLPDQPGADVTLVYLLAHKDAAAMKASFGAFAKDADWVAARSASEKKAGGPLTEKAGGVVSVLLAPTDYSPLK